jgi:methylmalonyl-CoA mutase N-terminal domain/subunit
MDRQQTEKTFTTISGIPIKRVYTPEDVANLDYDKDIGLPGQAPFVRGIYPDMYRERLWRIVQLSGRRERNYFRSRPHGLLFNVGC